MCNYILSLKNDRGNNKPCNDSHNEHMDNMFSTHVNSYNIKPRHASLYQRINKLPYLCIYDALLFMNVSILKIVWMIMNTAAIILVESLPETKKSKQNITKTRTCSTKTQLAHSH